jgi:two-component system phosphate regulon sensor histidine kinase PhoR
MLVGWLFGAPVAGLVIGMVLAAVLALALARWGTRRLAGIGQASSPTDIEYAERDEIDRAIQAFARFARESDDRLGGILAELEQQTFLLDRMNDGLMRVGADGRVIYANVAASALFGGRNPSGRSFIRVSRDYELHQALRRCLESGLEQQHTIELPGEARLVNVVFARVAADPPEALVTLRDVTDVIRLQHLRRDFVANVSHELRTPLSTMKILAETLMELRPDDDEILDFLRRINGEIDAMTTLVRDLLDLTRLETPGGQLAMRQLDAVQLVRDVRDRMLPQAERQGVALLATTTLETCAIDGDERRLHQALVNLVSNAIRHTAAGGTVEISVEAAGHEVVFSVRDTGVGIRAEDLERVWERFFKVDRARTGIGSGLGLAIVKHIALAHQGSVSVSSVPGTGSQFSMRLPLHQDGPRRESTAGAD